MKWHRAERRLGPSESEIADDRLYYSVQELFEDPLKLLDASSYLELRRLEAIQRPRRWGEPADYFVASIYNPDPRLDAQDQAYWYRVDTAARRWFDPFKVPGQEENVVHGLSNSAEQFIVDSVIIDHSDK